MNLAQAIEPVYAADSAEWQELASAIGWQVPAIFWYASAGFDVQPLIQYHQCRMPARVLKEVGDDLLCVLTDYSPYVLSALKKTYERLDFGSVKLREVTEFGNSDFVVHQMIPLRVFVPEEVERIREAYSYIRHNVIPDQEWHMCYLNASVNGYGCSALYVLIENLVFWKEICEPCALRVPLFCALRVGGKSGSWDSTHSPRRGKLWNAIRQSGLHPSNRPLWWIADNYVELRHYWDGLGFDGQGKFEEDQWYGIPHYFRCDWSIGVTVAYRTGTRVDYPIGAEPPEYRLAVACYDDDMDAVREVLATYPTVDLDAAVLHSRLRGNGTPLVLTGAEEIARFLIARGADVNHCYYNGRDYITPLDSAERELSNHWVRAFPYRTDRAIALIRYLESVGGKRSSMLGHVGET